MATYSSILACRIPWTEEPGTRDIYREREGGIYISHIYIFLSLYIYALPSLLRCKCSADEC